MNTAGPESLLGGAISAGWGTLFDKPSEYGTHWQGFGKRYGMAPYGRLGQQRDGGRHGRDLGRGSAL
jgi:hypothetical protein